jgi:hypothetical protein
MTDQDKLKLVLSMARRLRTDDPEDLPLKTGVAGSDTLVDISTVPGVSGSFHVRVRDADCDIKELIRLATLQHMRDDAGRLHVQSRPVTSLQLMIRHGLLLGWRLPAKRTGEDGNDEVVAVHCDVLKVGKEKAEELLNSQLDQGIAGAAFATIDAALGISGQTEVNDLVDSAGNSSEPSASSEETQ